MKIVLITTGGTIDKVYFDSKSTYEVGDSLIPELLREANIGVEYEVLPLARKDSLDFTQDDRAAIRKAIETNDASCFVITHGTDTMRETALALKGIPKKVIVLTGAMQPARFKATDAIFNIGAAITSVQILDPGVYIAMNGKIFNPDTCRKNREAHRFETIQTQ